MGLDRAGGGVEVSVCRFPARSVDPCVPSELPSAYLSRYVGWSRWDGQGRTCVYHVSLFCFRMRSMCAAGKQGQSQPYLRAAAHQSVARSCCNQFRATCQGTISGLSQPGIASHVRSCRSTEGILRKGRRRSSNETKITSFASALSPLWRKARAIGPLAGPGLSDQYLVEPADP